MSRKPKHRRAQQPAPPRPPDWAVPELLRILDIVGGEDWISDMLLARCLPTIGPATEPTLWSVLRDDRRGPVMRGQAVLGLRRLVRYYPERHDDISNGLMDFLLETDPADLAAPERQRVNADVGLVLDEEPFADADWLAARRATAELLSPAPPAPPT